MYLFSICLRSIPPFEIFIDVSNIFKEIGQLNVSASVFYVEIQLSQSFKSQNTVIYTL